jgi:DNA primase
MPTKWIDFKALKERVHIRDVLTHYGLLDHLAEKKPGKLVGPCPLHGGKNGTSFHVDCEKNIWHCFSECGGGNVIDLVMKLEHVSIRDAGVKLCTWFDLGFDRPTKRDEAKVPPSKKSANVSQEKNKGSTADKPTEPTINPPLGRELKLDHEHAYLWARGLTAPTVRTFGVGFCTRGIMKNRIAIPIENDRGELVAYAGRAVDDELAREEGKYKLPAGFQKSHVVYNLSRVREHGREGLIVVEGFFDAMKVHQAGFPNVVALMGSQLSEPQTELLVSATDRLVLMFDGDDAGVTCTREFYKRLRRRVFLKEVALEPGQQPDALDASTLKTLLGGERQ